jgi:hypothetical protein
MIPASPLDARMMTHPTKRRLSPPQSNASSMSSMPSVSSALTTLIAELTKRDIAREERERQKELERMAEREDRWERESREERDRRCIKS